MPEFSLDVYGSTIRVISGEENSLVSLRREFQAFAANAPTPKFIVTLSRENPDTSRIPKNLLGKVGHHAITYAQYDMRWHAWHGQALVEHNTRTGTMLIQTMDADLLHELGYLAILSLTGKELDQRGYHKIHAAGIRWRALDIIVMMPSGGGKTTHFLEWMRYNDCEIISDDTPLISPDGNIMPFPLRIGVNAIPDFLEHLKHDAILFKRQNYSAKWLIPVGLLGKVAQGPTHGLALIQGQRWNSPHSVIQPISRPRMAIFLIEHLVIGVGLPMVVEFFVKGTFSDWLRLIRIACSRQITALKLLSRGECYLLRMGTDPAEAVKTTRQFLENQI